MKRCFASGLSVLLLASLFAACGSSAHPEGSPGEADGGESSAPPHGGSGGHTPTTPTEGGVAGTVEEAGGVAGSAGSDVAGEGGTGGAVDVVVECPSSGGAIVLPDAVLDAAVRDALGLTNQPLTAEIARKLETLSVANPALRSFEGLQCFTGLEDLTILLSSVSDVSRLAGLSRLTHLNLSGNQIADVKPLAGLSALSTLTLVANPVSDVTPIMGLRNLVTLQLGTTKVRDLKPFQAFQAACDVSLTNDSLTDLAPLAGLSNLTGLDLSANQISDVTALAGLTGLRRLWLNGNPLTSFASLGELPNIRDFSAGPKIASWQSIGGLSGIDTLLINGGDTPTDLAPLGDLGQLTTLRIDDATQVASYAAIASVPALRYLTLYSDTLTDISFLSTMDTLVGIDIRNTDVADLSALSALSQLRDVALVNDRVSELSPLVDNVALGETSSVDVGGNPLDCAAQAASLKALRDRGVALSSDCP